METIDIDGIRYVRASVAAKEFGYTADYVGQLSRGGKISARQVGRVWYIRDGELGKHKRENVRSNKEKTREGLRLAKEMESHQIHNVMYDPHAFMPEYRKRLMDTSVRYESDKAPTSIHLSKSADSEPTSVRVETQVRDKIGGSQEVSVFRPPIVEDEAGAEDMESPGEEEINLRPISEMRRESRIPVHEPPLEGVLTIEDLEEDEDAPYGEVDEDPNGMGYISEQLGEIDPMQEAFLERLGVRDESGEGAVEPTIQRVRAVASLKEKSFSFPSPVIVLVPALLIAALCFSVSSVFLEGVWVYEQGAGKSERPLFETSYGVRAMSAVAESLLSHEW